MKIIFAVFVFLAACSGYQDQPKDFGAIQAQGASAPPPREVPRTDTDLDPVGFDETFQEFLDKYVVILPGKYDTRIKYKAYSNDLKKKDAQTLSLRTEIINYFGSDTYEGLNLDEKIAFITNAYNFFVIDLIARKYPIKQIFEATPGEEVFKVNFINLAGQNMSLDYLEKTKLAKVLKTKLGNPNGNLTDARLHFALICGAKGCPILLDKVYKAETLEEQLTDITKKSFALPRIIQEKSSHYSLIKLFEWYKDDFNNHSSSDLPSVSNHKDFIARYFPGTFNSAKILKVDIEYNWDLNQI